MRKRKERKRKGSGLEKIVYGIKMTELHYAKDWPLSGKGDTFIFATKLKEQLRIGR